MFFFPFLSDSGKTGCYALSKFTLKTKKYMHVLISTTDGFKFQDSIDTKVYPSLEKLIRESVETRGYRPVFSRDPYALGDDDTGTNYDEFQKTSYTVYGNQNDIK